MSSPGTLRASSKRPLCVIAARGGSQGVPGKNIRPLCGKPVIAWAIEKALAAREFERVVVSTDHAEIARIAAQAGAEVPFTRPAELSGPDAGKFQVWQHALRECEARYGEQYEAYVDIDCTNPLLELEDIRAALAQFRAARRRGVDAVFTVCRARRNPYFNLVEPDASGALRMSKRLRAARCSRVKRRRRCSSMSRACTCSIRNTSRAPIICSTAMPRATRCPKAAISTSIASLTSG
jgi:CMP-N,N'-diacetyllegionaminic acid synthase